MKLVLPLVMFLTGCASYVPLPWGTDWRVHDGGTVQISGKPVFSPIGEPLLYLCPPGYAGEATGNCLDVVAPPLVVAELRNSSAQCVAVSGTFNGFGPERVGTGNFRSELGYIKAARVGPCHER